MFTLTPVEHTPGAKGAPRLPISDEYDKLLEQLQQQPDQWFEVIKDDKDHRSTTRVRAAMTSRGCKTSRPTRKLRGKTVYSLRVLWPSDGDHLTNHLLSRSLRRSHGRALEPSPVGPDYA